MNLQIVSVHLSHNLMYDLVLYMSDILLFNLLDKNDRKETQNNEAQNDRKETKTAAKRQKRPQRDTEQYQRDKKNHKEMHDNDIETKNDRKKWDAGTLTTKCTSFLWICGPVCAQDNDNSLETRLWGSVKSFRFWFFKQNCEQSQHTQESKHRKLKYFYLQWKIRSTSCFLSYSPSAVGRKLSPEGPHRL